MTALRWPRWLRGLLGRERGQRERWVKTPTGFHYLPGSLALTLHYNAQPGRWCPLCQETSPPSSAPQDAPGTASAKDIETRAATPRGKSTL